ncbi:hypothetical protein LINPERHAP1_LOCUS17427 [Linum perenne]
MTRNGQKGCEQCHDFVEASKDTQSFDEFSYEEDDVLCHYKLRASRRISHTEANPHRKFFGCLLYKSSDDNGCGFFLWYDTKIQLDKHHLTKMVGNLTLQLRQVEDEKKKLESTLERVIDRSSAEACSSYIVQPNESYILHELEEIKDRLARLEDAVFFNP